MFLREGELTLGVWLPLALARLIQVVAKVAGGELKMGDILAGFCLPQMAKAAERDENEAEAAATLARFEELGRKFGVKNGGN